MNKNTFTTVALEQGEMHIYDFGHLKLHAYQTCDPLSDETFLVEKDGNIVILEPPCFFGNIAALTKYLENKHVVGMLVAYHGRRRHIPAGGSQVRHSQCAVMPHKVVERPW